MARILVHFELLHTTGMGTADTYIRLSNCTFFYLGMGPFKYCVSKEVGGCEEMLTSYLGGYEEMLMSKKVKNVLM